MHIIPADIPKPKDEADFERMCAKVYGWVFQDRLPKMNGRRGQAQGGVDVFVNAKDIGRIGIQCKKYFTTALTLDHVTEEIEKADKKQIPIKILLIATTAPNDAVLLHEVQGLSDKREAHGLFKVEIEFWEDIENRINQHTILQDSYAPHSPGAAYHRQEQQLAHITDMVVETRDKVAGLDALPSAREDSTDKLINGQLDRTNELFKSNQYSAALDHLSSIGSDLRPFDAHQKARWYLQRGLALWFQQNDAKEAAELFIKAAETYPDDERMAAARIRGLMLKEEFQAAVAAGEVGIDQFPVSQHIWVAYQNARLANGEMVQLKDFPACLREEQDVLQTAALAARQQENFEDALKLSEKAATLPDSGFFSRATALRMIVEEVARHPISALYGFLPKITLERLERAIDLFTPRPARLWAVQSAIVEDVATHLGYALLLCKEYDKALELAKDSDAHGFRSKRLLRVHIQALLELKRYDEAIALGRECASDLAEESLIMLVETAASRGNVQFVEDALVWVNGWSPEQPEVLKAVIAFKWIALSRAGQLARAVREIAAAEISTSNSLIYCSVAARVFKAAEQPLEAVEAIERAKSLVDENSHESDRLMLADLLFSAERWLDAASLYEGLISVGISELHSRLLECYLHAGRRKKAKALLTSLPLGWVENDDLRRLAFELGQEASDWSFLVPLTDTQVERYPQHTASWLFKLHVARHVRSLAEFQDLVREVPEDLDGPVPPTAQLAAMELRYDEAARGLRRLYRLARHHFDEGEAISAYFGCVVTAPQSLPLMEEKLPSVVPGSSVRLMDVNGQEVEVTIDPADVGVLPKRAQFLSHNSPEAQSMLGAQVGDTVFIPVAFGGHQLYKVAEIQSAYRRMVQVAHERARSLGGLPYMKAVSIGMTGDPAKDLGQMHDEIQRGKETSIRLFDAYGAGRLTLAGLAHWTGKSVIQVAAWWPSDAPPIFTGRGTAEERDEALALLARPNAGYVIDALTLAELVQFGVPEALGVLPKLYISPVTQQILEDHLEYTESDRSVGMAVEVEGQLRIIEHDDEYHRRQLQFAKQLVEVAGQYCIVKPAYGELPVHPQLPNLIDVLQDEEREMLLLAQEQGAVLVTLDGRLRMLAKELAGLAGIWPQPLIMHAAATGKTPHRKASEFTISEFLGNRKFVALSASDLVWMVLQGDTYLWQGMRALKRYLEDPDTELKSLTEVVLEFLRLIARQAQLGAFGELLAHIVEALSRRKDCPSNFEELIAAYIDDMIINAAGKPQPFELLDGHRQALIENRRRYLAARYLEARSRASDSPDASPIAVRVLFCTKIPTLILDKRMAEKSPESVPPYETNSEVGDQGVAEAIDRGSDSQVASSSV